MAKHGKSYNAAAEKIDRATLYTPLQAAKLIKGGGGGQPHFAQAGGKDKDGLSAAVDKVVELAQL